MKYETYKRIKRMGGDISKVKESRKNGEFCIRCGCLLTKNNKSFDSRLCKVCFATETSEVAVEDMYDDSLTDSERSAQFLGYFVSLFSIDSWFKSGLGSILTLFRLLDCSSCQDFMSCLRIYSAMGGYSFEWNLLKSKR